MICVQQKWQADECDTIVNALKRAREVFPGKLFLDFDGDSITFHDFDRDSTWMAHGLKELGVASGDTVASLLDNNLNSILLWFAVNKLGAIHVPVNTAYKGEFLRHQLADCGAKIIISESDYATRVAQVASGLPDVHTFLYAGDKPDCHIQEWRIQPLEKSVVESDAPLDISVRPDQLSVLIYTAGTTGPSKGCMVSHNYICNLARQSIEVTGKTSGDIHWSCLPLFHLNATATVVLSSLLVGGMAAISRRFSVSRFWSEIERSGATVANILGSMIPLLADAPENDAMKRCRGQLRAVVGAPFPAELQKKWRDRFDIHYAGANVFGLSESSLLTSLPLSAPAPPGSSGKRNVCFDVRIIDEEGNELPPGDTGEIIARPLKPHVMFEGYWNRPEDTTKVMKNMWFHTGDIGKFDEDGFFYFVDRKKDYLRRRGENISSFEMETTFRKHPDIVDLAVHAVFSDLGEDDVKVTALMVEGSTVTEEELCCWAIERLPYFAIPRYIEFRKELPRNPVGRILKYKLREEGCTPRTWDRERSTIELVKR